MCILYIMDRIGFDNDKYVRMQSENIRTRIAQFGDKLYLEFGGKLFDDYHASRVLPGFLPDSKVNMLQTLKDDAEIILAIHAGDIEKNKIRNDLDIAYDNEVLRLIDAFRSKELYVGGVVSPVTAGSLRRTRSSSGWSGLASASIVIIRSMGIPAMFR